MASALRFIFRVKTEVHQGIVALAGFHNDVAAVTAIAAGWPTPRNILFPAERQATVAAIASFYPDCSFIDEHEDMCFLCEPSCPLWLMKFKCLNHKGHEGSQKKREANNHP